MGNRRSWEPANAVTALVSGLKTEKFRGQRAPGINRRRVGDAEALQKARSVTESMGARLAGTLAVIYATVKGK